MASSNSGLIAVTLSHFSSATAILSSHVRDGPSRNGLSFTGDTISVSPKVIAIESCRYLPHAIRMASLSE
jgi:hypothetical protein